PEKTPDFLFGFSPSLSSSGAMALPVPAASMSAPVSLDSLAEALASTGDCSAAALDCCSLGSVSVADNSGELSLVSDASSAGGESNGSCAAEGEATVEIPNASTACNFRSIALPYSLVTT